METNLGGIASGFLFRKYMFDLGTLLDSEYNLCIGDKIIALILLADDLVLSSDSKNAILIRNAVFILKYQLHCVISTTFCVFHRQQWLICQYMFCLIYICILIHMCMH